MSDIIPLYQVLREEFGRRTLENTPLPVAIESNLNPAFPIRPYQKEALQHFLQYWHEPFAGKPSQNHQLLFHMATGSGKTLLMAGLILHLYTQGYRNFLFFVNSNNIIGKTRDNFLNPLSQKYLFSETISIGDKRVNVRAVDTFQSCNEDDINIVFSTIQGLHGNLQSARENSVTIDDFAGKRMVLISDEAHHINATTKKSRKVG